jgi:hypothetical protein
MLLKRSWNLTHKQQGPSYDGPLFIRVGLEPVHQDVQAEPNHINEVPVPRCTFKAKVAIRSEVTTLQTQCDEQQHQRAKEHMETMEAGQHEEG